MAVLTIAPEARVVMTCSDCTWWADVTELHGWGTNLPQVHVENCHLMQTWPTFRMLGLMSTGFYLAGVSRSYRPPFAIVGGHRVLCTDDIIHEKATWDPTKRKFNMHVPKM